MASTPINGETKNAPMSGSNARRCGLVTISSDTPDESALAFSVSSDVGPATAKSFGIAYDLAEELRPIYTRSGHALPDDLRFWGMRAHEASSIIGGEWGSGPASPAAAAGFRVPVCARNQ